MIEQKIYPSGIERLTFTVTDTGEEIELVVFNEDWSDKYQIALSLENAEKLLEELKEAIEYEKSPYKEESEEYT